MPADRVCGCQNNNGPFGGMFGNGGCGRGCGGDSTILFFLIVFLLLFTNCGCCNN